jgi:hypothetical protein
MKFEIINPSDEAYIEGSFEACAIATILFGDGKYALRGDDGTTKLPLLFTEQALVEWTQKHFNKDIKQVFEENKEAVVDALLSVHLVRERTSINNFTSVAHNLGNWLKKDNEEQKKKSQE